MDAPAFLAPYLLELHPPQVVEAPPDTCPTAGRLRLEWYRAVPGWERDLTLADLREHEKHCLRCLRRNDWIRRLEENTTISPHIWSNEELRTPLTTELTRPPARTEEI